MSAVEPRSVLVWYNPISGKGRSRERAEAVASCLRGAGFRVELEETRAEGLRPEEAAERGRRFDAAVIAGGDGTVMNLLGTLSHAALPFYVLPTGNQSLFSKLFLMSAEPGTVCRALQQMSVEEHHFARVNGRPFFHMVSMGLDSQVICTMASTRSGTVTNASYIVPTLQTLARHTPAVITATLDGKQILADEQGYLIAANSPAYAGGLNPAPEASSRSGRLCVRFFPNLRTAGYLRWGVCFLRKQPVPNRDARTFFGTRLQVTPTDGAYPFQADGEAAGQGGFSVQLGETVRVILPVGYSAPVG